MTKRASDIVPGDRVLTESGERTVTKVDRGMLFGHLHISWRDGWGEVHHKAEVMVAA